jgi:gamma-glutamylaminecyclotransferase
LEPTRLFIYGTLKAGQSNRGWLAQARLVRKTRTQPRYRLHNMGALPALVEGGDQAVEGELYEVGDVTIVALDFLESVPRLYHRASVQLEDRSWAEAYFLKPEQVCGRPVIASGSWRDRWRTTSQPAAFVPRSGCRNGRARRARRRR